VRGEAAIVLTMWLGLGTACISAAQVESSNPTDSDTDPLGSGNNLEDVQETLRVLSEAGVPPTREDLVRFLEEADRKTDSASGWGLPFRTRGSFQLRVGHFQHLGWDKYGKVTLETTWLRARARVRVSGAGKREATGTLAVGRDFFEVRVGELGLVQGHGLLVAAPGRSPALAADTGFAPPRERLVTWLGYPDSRALSGWAMEARLKSWILRILSGRRRPTPTVPARHIEIIQVGIHHRNWGISATGLSGKPAMGASLAGEWMAQPLSASFETVVWQAGHGIPPTGAAVLQVRWNPVRGSGIEGAFGLADHAKSPGLASRPPVLSGWSGQGFVLRAFTRFGSGFSMQALVHRGRHRDRTGSSSRNEKILVDLQARKTVSPFVSLAVRLRSTGLRSWSWSERYPWQPPRADMPRRRAVLSAQVTLERGAMGGRLLVRSYGLDQEGPGGRRNLIGLSGKYGVGQAWKLRGTWVTAWGEPVDLVSAIVPMTGYVLPRHWGHWRSETVLGLEWAGHGARIQVAGSIRYPELESGNSPVPTLWVEVDVRW
jgi:hypothetical protein